MRARDLASVLMAVGALCYLVAFAVAFSIGPDDDRDRDPAPIAPDPADFGPAEPRMEPEVIARLATLDARV